MCDLSPVSNVTATLMGILVLGILVGAWFVFRATKLVRAVRISVVVAMVLGAAAFAYFLAGSYRAVAHFDQEGLSLDIPVYRTNVLWNELALEESRVVDMAVDRDLAPATRTNGLGMYGYSLGWFRLQNGRSALVSITDRSKVVHLSRVGGTSILFSCGSGDSLVDWLRNRGEGNRGE